MMLWPEDVTPLQVAHSDLPVTVLAFSSAFTRLADANAARIATAHSILTRFM
jgi:hypothetical protein